ncbi:Hypothetical protein CAP_3711 [Chondromyces apiculatus DSM 436]|uniref:Uncharacterized protein n=1 Tax=Chondromyces apiculatus DSM 436 TaxID=1192034 RepID=A0A017T7W3_9BACT|nr:Hypothetical protein CAP_3711 [Chondromyces apiculatus DSM 436]
MRGHVDRRHPADAHQPVETVLALEDASDTPTCADQDGIGGRHGRLDAPSAPRAPTSVNESPCRRKASSPERLTETRSAADLESLNPPGCFIPERPLQPLRATLHATPAQSRATP